MKSLMPLINKELKRFFTDKRLLLSLLLPGLMIFLMYTLIGNIMGDLYSLDENKEYIVYVENRSLMMDTIMEDSGLKIITNVITSDEEIPQIKEKIKTGEVHLLILYPEGFDDIFAGLSPTEQTYPQVKMYYNADVVASQMLFYTYQEVMNFLESEITNLFDINMSLDDQYNLSAKGDDMNPFLSMIPMLLLVFLVSGVVSVATESIAGEKERGTIATLLITPVSRLKLATAKILAVSIPSIVSAVVSFLGLYLAFPALTKMMGDEINTSITLGFGEACGLLLIMIVTVLMFTVLISIISTFAKSVKESQQFTAPLIIVASMSGLITMVATMPSLGFFCIPMANTALVITSIFNGTFDVMQLMVSVGVNLVITVIGIFVIAKMFNSEKVIFNK